jgi:phytoene synthase
MRVSATLMKEPERLSPVPSNGRAPPSLNGKVKVLRGPEVEEDAMRKCILVHQRTNASHRSLSPLRGRWDASKLEEAYERCGQVTSEYAKTFYLGTQVGAGEGPRAADSCNAPCTGVLQAAICRF